MSTTTKTYKVNQIKQLIELNGSLTNFSADFIIESKNFTPFKALIISETDLNSGNPIVYQEVKDGKINGNITNDKGVHESYFILLKSDVPTECQVTINLNEVLLNSDIIRYQEELDKQKIDEERRLEFNKHKKLQEDEYLKKNKKKSTGKNNKFKINWIFILGLVVLVCVGIWFFIKKKKQPLINTVKNIESINEIPSAPLLENLPPAPLLDNLPDRGTESNIKVKTNSDLAKKINDYFGK